MQTKIVQRGIPATESASVPHDPIPVGLDLVVMLTVSPFKIARNYHKISQKRLDLEPNKFPIWRCDKGSVV